MPKVSVLIPAYNHERYVKYAIQSVLDQRFEDFEIIIVDDGSSDTTLRQIQDFSDPRIKVFVHEKNLGAVVAERTCFEHSVGEYIAILNSDDMFLPDKLEKQVKFLDENTHYGAVFSQAEIIDENGDSFTDKNHFYYRIFEQPVRDRYQWLNFFFNSANCLCHPSVLIRRQCYDTIGFYDERFAQLPDFDFWIRLCLQYEIFILPEKLVKFRVLTNNKNASGGSKETQIRHSIEFYQILNNFLSIPSYKDFIKIFPRTDITLNYEDTDLIPYFIARLCLEKKSPIYHLFALKVLNTLFADKGMVKKLHEKFNFSSADLIRYTGSFEIFNFNPPEKAERAVTNKRVGILYDNISGNTGDVAIGLSLKKILQQLNVEFDELIPGNFNPLDYYTIIVGGGYLLRQSPDFFYDKFRVPGNHILNAMGIYGEPKDLDYLKSYKYITVRSNGDKKKLAYLNEDIRVIPCTTMLLEDVPDLSFTFKKPCIGIHIFPLFSKDEEDQFIRWASSLPFTIYFVPITHYNKDIQYMRYLKEKIPNSEVLPILKAQEIFTICGKFDFFISFSLHGAIFSYVHNVPFILFDAADKMKFFLEDRNLEYLLVKKFSDLERVFQSIRDSPPDFSKKIQEDKETLKLHINRIRELMPESGQYIPVTPEKTSYDHQIFFLLQRLKDQERENDILKNENNLIKSRIAWRILTFFHKKDH